MGSLVTRAAVEAVAASRYWREEDARIALGAWRDSGMSLGCFAREVGLNVQRLRRWARELRDLGSSEEAVVAPAPRLHPVRVVLGVSQPEAVPEEEQATLEVVVRGGRRIVVRAGFDPAVLGRLVTALEALC